MTCFAVIYIRESKKVKVCLHAPSVGPSFETRTVKKYLFIQLTFSMSNHKLSTFRIKQVYDNNLGTFVRLNRFI